MHGKLKAHDRLCRHADDIRVRRYATDAERFLRAPRATLGAQEGKFLHGRALLLALLFAPADGDGLLVHQHQQVYLRAAGRRWSSGSGVRAVSFLSAFPTLVLSLFSSQNDHFLRDSKADKLTHRFCKRYVPPGGFCDSDLFFGAIWFQRVKQYCLLNGIAVVEVNNFVRDGWESWGDIWNGPHFLILVVSLFLSPLCLSRSYC